MKTLAVLSVSLLLAAAMPARAVTVLFDDGFAGPLDPAWVVTADPGMGVSVSNGTLFANFLNPPGGTQEATIVRQLPSPIVLDDQPGPVTWGFNIRRDSLSGAGNNPENDIVPNASAYVLAASSVDLTTGEGYLLALMNPDDGVRDAGTGGIMPMLARYTGGIQGTVTVLSALDNTNALRGQVHDAHVSLQVVYTPGPHSWGIRGVASDVFVDPLSLDDGHLIVPIITDSTYAGIPLEYAGLYHGGSAGGAARNRDVWFDNVSMSVEDSQLDAIPEPLTFCGALLGIGAVGGRVRRRLRRA